MQSNAGLTDVCQGLMGALALVPVLFAPGYLVNRLTGRLTRRGAAPVDSIAASLVLSFSVLPIFLYLIGRVSMTGTRLFFWSSVVTFAFFLWHKRKNVKTLPWTPGFYVFTFVALMWTVVAFGSQIDLQAQGRVYTSSLAYDHALRIAIISAISRSHSLPPPDPYLHVGSAVPLSYHYFWFLLCSLVSREAPRWIGPRGAMIAGTFWTGLMVLGVLSLWMRSIRRTNDNPGLRWGVSGLLLAISGLDVIAFLVAVGQHCAAHDPHWILYPSLDWWSYDQVTNWVDALLWVPHCAAALGACCTGLLFLLDNKGSSQKRTLLFALIAGACFASATGMSVYVTFGFVAFYVTFLFVLILRKDFSQFAAGCFAGFTAILLACPFLLDLVRHQPGQSFMHFGFRLPSGLIFSVLHLGHGARVALYFPAVVLTLLIEFGFFALAFWYWYKGRAFGDSKQYRTLLLLMFLIPLGITSILRSDAVDTNDLGMRGMFPAQFALAVIAGSWILSSIAPQSSSIRLAQLFRTIPRSARVLVVLGLITTLADLTLLRTFTLFQEKGHVKNAFIISPDVGFTTKSARDAYAWLGDHSRVSAVVQSNPSKYLDYLLGLYGNRQSIVGGRAELRYKTAHLAEIREAMAQLGRLFDGQEAAATVDPNELCFRWGIDYLFVDSADPVWNSNNAWIWKVPVAYQNAGSRIYACPSKSTSSGRMAKISRVVLQ